MRLTRIELAGYRGFDDVTFDLRHPDGDPLPVAAIVGPNGSGKSSVLHAVSAMLSGVSPEYGGRRFVTGDVSGGMAEVTIAIEDEIDGDPIAFTLVAQGNRVLHWTVGGAAEPFSRWSAALSGSEHRATGLAVAFDAHRLLPPIEVSAVNNTRVASSPRSNALAPSLRRDQTMWFRFAHLEQWIVSLDHLRARAKADRNEPFPLWDLLVQGLDEILAPVRFEGVDEALDVRFATPKGSVPLAALSDGFRSVFVIVAELILRLSMASEDPYAALDQRALCLIDEVDAHLHPRWQGQIVRGLQKMFPRVQFVVTTHSPFVVASLEPHEVFRLGDIDP
jgi:ABC-type branched-subunit amino acid transport system ATPase component